MKSNGIIEIPGLKDLKDRFKFIENTTLRENLAIAFQYIIFLLSVESEFKLPGAVKYSIYKNMILHTATIVESCINYCIGFLIKKGKISANEMPKEKKYSNCKVLYKVSEDLQICGIHIKNKPLKFKSNIQFQMLNKIAKNTGVLNNNLYNKSEKLREWRNRIHLAALEEIDDLYDKKDTDKAFGFAKEIIGSLENKITENNN
ncbi:hypothetical protein ES703_96006 [subsurface metagenome]